MPATLVISDYLGVQHSSNDYYGGDNGGAEGAWWLGSGHHIGFFGCDFRGCICFKLHSYWNERLR